MNFIDGVLLSLYSWLHFVKIEQKVTNYCRMISWGLESIGMNDSVTDHDCGKKYTTVFSSPQRHRRVK